MGKGVRRLFLDIAPGERRGVVWLDGRPERLLVERDGEGEGELGRVRLGERRIGRLRELSPDRRRGYMALGAGPDGVTALADPPPLGAVLEVEVVAEAYADKGPRLRLIGAGEGAPRLLAPAPSLETRLAGWAPGAPIEAGDAAEAAADAAQEAALETRHALGRGLVLHVEPTRALTAVDVDLAAGAHGRRAAEANLRAVRHAVRLLRLKGFGGAAVIDLAGAPKSGEGTGARYAEEALAACAPDGDGCVALAPDRLGLLRLSRPRTFRPVTETLLSLDGAPVSGTLAPRPLAQALVRAMIREGRADPGGRVEAVCAPQVAAELRPLAARLGPRFQVRDDPTRAPSAGAVSVW